MALRKLYTVCAILFWQKKYAGYVFGFTVARSTDEVQRIVRMHVPADKTFNLEQACDGTVNYLVARGAADTFLRHELVWLDPRPPRERDKTPVPDLVVRLMTEGHAL